MEIRKMTAREIPQVAELEKICFSQPWSEKSVAGELENQTLPDAASCMRAAIQSSPGLSPTCRRLLVQLGRGLGRFDLPGQLQDIQAVKAACREQRRRLEKDREVRLRSYRTLGLCAGAALVILFF